MTEIKYLKDWEYDINSYIGCSYCFEECPVFKDIRQEADGARDKVILSYRFIIGQLETSKFIADKREFRHLIQV